MPPKKNEANTSISFPPTSPAETQPATNIADGDSFDKINEELKSFMA